ncbi:MULTISPECIES: porphobilinogen synthase [Candidatus Ichthyocystis]|uniref:Delta-aminolevulinic acid dehydratase n=1 Tax=Candidatus Ichthyocystis hellenicum TaxID=1561003 RepID=A0A0S4M550_9BURK|nr:MULTISPECIES: porphobilinogen synthase [Ichthyocystis]CUT17405.1 porphobilinogen synthase / delta-aminolevulinic acid dehydratase [Candidatus Ichthyocystis hellenicum]
MRAYFSHRSFPATRLRRLRKNWFSRALVQESSLSVGDMILPVFICEGESVESSVPCMPNVFCYSLDRLMFYLEKVVTAGIPAIELFPRINSDVKDLTGSQALMEDDIVCKAVRAIKGNFPDLGVMTDVALDPYTSNGQDGIVDEFGYVINDATNDILVKQALNHVCAGADMVSPSDMMDGRVLCIRQALELNNFHNAIIVAHSAKYASALYGPFRYAVGSSVNLGRATKETYQLDPANRSEALSEACLDLTEGADVVLVKPGLPYLDVLYAIKDLLGAPTFVYHVSGEYSMIKSAAQAGFIDEKKVVLESLLAFKRAGADAILTYYALDVANWLCEAG